MISLSTTQKIQAFLAGSVSSTQPSVVVTYSDNTTTAPYVVRKTSVSNLNNTTVVDILASPSSGRRDISSLSIRNRDSGSVTVTVRFNNSGTTYEIIKVTLAAGSSLFFGGDDSWYVIDSSGNEKEVLAAVPASVLTGTVATANGGTGQDFSASTGMILLTSGTASVISTTGTGSAVRATSPTLVTPILGTPTSGDLSNCTNYPVASLSGLGTGVATALAVNVGTDGAFVVKAGVLGTPSSGTLTNCTGLPVSTGISGLGTGVATFLATPSSANLASAVTDETGSGALVFGTSPTFTTQITSPIVYGSSSSGGDLTLNSTSHATKGKIFLGANSAYDGTNKFLGIGTTSPDAALHVVGTVTNATGVKLSPALSIGTAGNGNAIITSQASITLNNTITVLYGMLFIPTMATSSNSITSVPCMYARMDTAAGYSGTVTNSFCFLADQGTWSGTSPTNAYGYYANLTAGSARWNFYGASDAKSRLAGHLYMATGKSLINGESALATNATDGFLYIPTCAGAPTGVPTTQTGTCALVYDTSNNKLYVYNAAWKSVTLA